MDDPETVDAMEELRAEQTADEEKRDSAAAVDDRNESQDAYADLGGGGVIALLNQFNDGLLEPAPQGLGLEDGDEVKRFLDETTALVDIAGSEADGLAVATSPIVDESESGEQAPVDLGLEREDGAIEPVNSVDPLTLPSEASGNVQTEGIGVTLAGANPAPAEIVGDTAVYPNAIAGADLDYLLKPSGPSGFEASVQLRSAESPERFELALSLPSGSSLVALDPNESLALAAEVRGANGETLMGITPPVAWGADGAPVEVETSVEADRLVFDVAHRDEDVAHPVIVDPNFYTDTSDAGSHAGNGTPPPGRGWNGSWYGQQGSGIYSIVANGYFFSQADYHCACYSYGIPLWGWYPHGDFAGWYFDSPGQESSIYSVEYRNVYHWQNYSAFVWGIYDAAPSPYWERLSSYGGDLYNTTVGDCCAGEPDNRAWVYVQSVGEGAYGNGWRWSRDGYGMIYQIAFNNALLDIRDSTPPQTYLVSNNAPTGWVRNAPIQTKTRATENGVGLKHFRLSFSPAMNVGGNSTPTIQQSLSCTNLTTNHCPTDGTSTDSQNFQYDAANMTEGINSVSAQSADLLGNWTNGGPSWQAKVDRSSPTQTISGDGWNPTLGVLTPGDKTISVNATDGVEGGALSQRRSGVEEIQLRIWGEGTLRPNQPTMRRNQTSSGCGTSRDSCPLNATFTYDPAEYAGERATSNVQLEVVSVDEIGNVTPIVQTQNRKTLVAAVPPIPDTTITSGPSYQEFSRNATFAFNSSIPGSDFDCRMDGGIWAPCTSPKTYTGLSEGNHLFEVAAKNILGYRDRSHEVFGWTILGADEVEELTAQANPEAIAASEEAISEVGDTFEPSVAGPTGSPLAFTSTGTAVSNTRIAVDPAQGLALPTDAGDLVVTPTAVAAGAPSGSIGGSQDIVVFPGTGSSSHTIIRPRPDGVETFTTLENASAPTSQSWTVALPGEESLALRADGAVEVLDGSGVAVARFNPPTSLAADGSGVPTEYSSSADTLTVTASTAGATFPVVVDPWITRIKGGSQPVVIARPRSFLFGYNEGFFVDPNRLIPLADEGGAKSIRLSANWCFVERTEGVYSWNAVDNQLNPLKTRNVANNNLGGIVQIGAAPYWATSEAVNDPSPPDPGEPCLDNQGSPSSPPDTTSPPGGGMPQRLQQFRNYVTAFVNRAASEGWLPHIDAIEIWNEPNLARFWGFEPIDPERFADIYMAAWDGIEAARQAATGDTALMIDRVPIITGGLTPVPGAGDGVAFQRVYLERAIARINAVASSKSPDGIGVHMYASREDTGQEVEERISEQYNEQITPALNATGKNHLPRWVTEFGYGSTPFWDPGLGETQPPPDYDRQRDILRRMFRYIRSGATNPNPVSLLVHRLVDPDPNGSEMNTIERLNFGTMRYAGAPQDPPRKRAFCALARELKTEWNDCLPGDE